MSAVTYIALRYLTAHKKISPSGLITTMAVIGVTVSIFAMMVVLSVFSGLRIMNEKSMSHLYPDIEISPTHGKTLIADSTLLSQINSITGIQHHSLTLTEKAFLRYRSHETICRIKGIDPHYPQVINMTDIQVGEINLSPDTLYGREEAMIGVKTAYLMQMNIPDYTHPITIYVPTTHNNRPISSFYRSIELTPSAYLTGSEGEENTIYIPLHIAQELLGKKATEATAIEIKLLPTAQKEKIAARLQNLLDAETYTIKTSDQKKEIMYKVMNTENIVLYFVFSLIIIIALFNVIGAIVMLIIEKKENLYTLRALGMNIKNIRRIFIYEGMMSVWIGSAIGMTAGILLVYLQEKYSFITIGGNTDIPYPVSLTIGNIITVLITIAILGYVASFIATSGMKKNLYTGTHEKN